MAQSVSQKHRTHLFQIDINKHFNPSRLSNIGVGMILIVGFLLPLPVLVSSPLHLDEALYAHWAQLISGQQDPMLHSVPVDKPPLFLYVLGFFFQVFTPSETVSRLPSLLAQSATLWLTYQVGQRWYNRRVGLTTMLLLALSPYHILFAPTALTDPLMVMFVMLSALAVTTGKLGWAGLWLGLAVATKQQGLFFLPLILGLIVIRDKGQGLPDVGARRTSPLHLGWFGLSFVLMLMIPLIWDAYRTYETGFWQQSALSYGGLSLTGAHIWTRFFSFVKLLRLITASTTLNIIFILGVPILCTLGWVYRWSEKATQYWMDWLLAGYCLSFIVLHACFSFQVWDRYLLGIVPLLCILLVRVLHIPEIFLQSGKFAITLIAFALIMGLMRQPVRQAMNGGYPLGGDHGSFQGVAEVATYLYRHAGANTTLYHHWLGTHWRYYLYGYPYDLLYWESITHLVEQASKNIAGTQYIAVPSWRSPTPLTLALSDAGLTLNIVYRTYRDDGTPAIYLYRIEPLHQKP
ncbi:MAG: glycosyltransferase family 39 protein [Chloroflexota bacterium]